MLDGVGLTAIEWAEKAEPLLPSRTVRVLMRGAGDEPRTLEIDGVPPDWVAPI
jgi:tRNA A37 threonylcarbamoyladenosine biosynthesis protein TsaE